MRSKLAVLLSLFFLLPIVPALAQLQVEKSPGEPVRITWDFLAADEAQISGFKLLVSDASDGDFTEQQTIAANVRVVVFQATTSPKFYRLVAYKTGPPELQSERTYPVLVNIKLKGILGVGVR